MTINPSSHTITTEESDSARVMNHVHHLGVRPFSALRSLLCFISTWPQQAVEKLSIGKETISFTYTHCAAHSSAALHSPSSSMRTLLSHKHCLVSPLLLYKAIHTDRVAPLHLDLQPFPFRNLFGDPQKPVFSFFSPCSIPKRTEHASCWMQVLYKLSTLLIFCLSSISSSLQKEMGRWMGQAEPKELE